MRLLLASSLSANAYACRAAVPSSTMSAASKRKRAGILESAADPIADDDSPRRRLTLYFDINETIMVGDPAGGDTYDDCLNKMICKAAFVRPNLSQATRAGRWSDWVWHDGSPLDPSLRRAGIAAPDLLFPWRRRRGTTQFYHVRFT